MGAARNRRIRRILRNKRDHHEALFTLFVILAAAVLIVNIVTKDKEFSANENRSLEQRPAFSLEALADGSYFSDFTTYYSDQFPLRDTWMSLKFKASYLMSQREFNGVYSGKDETLLQIPTTPDEEAVANTTEAINRFAENYPDKDIAVVIVPGAAAICKDKLPKDAPVRDQLDDISNMTGQLNSTIKRIDAASALASDKSEYIYYRTDHHWTSEGAYQVFLACTDPLKLAHEGLVYTPHVVSETFQGTLSSKSGDHRAKDTITVYEPQGTDVMYEVNYPDLQMRSRSMFVSDQLEEKDQYTVFFGGNHPLVEIRTTADNNRNLLIFKDSYANSFIQFLTPYYQTIVMVDPRYYYDDVSLAMNTYAITDVMFLYSADTILSDTALADVLNAAASTVSEEDGSSENPFDAIEITAVTDVPADGQAEDGTSLDTAGTEGENSGESVSEESYDDYEDDYEDYDYDGYEDDYEDYGDYAYDDDYAFAGDRRGGYSRYLKTIAGEYVYA